MIIGMEVPTTIGGWLASIGVISAVLLAWGTVVIRLARAHIDRRIDTQMKATVESAVMAAVRPLELQINNGLTKRTERIEDKVDLLITQLIQSKWDGDERRDKA